MHLVLDTPAPALPDAGAPVLRVHDDTPRERCEAYVDGHPEGTSYHRPQWCAVIERAFGHETRFFTAPPKLPAVAEP